MRMSDSPTWEQNLADACANIDAICAEQGVPVVFTDPDMIRISVQFLTIGKENLDARRLRGA